MTRARTFSELVDQLYEGSWNADLHRFRSPYAFRGLAAASHDLSTSLARLVAPLAVSGKTAHSDVTRLELSLVRNFRKYAHDQAGAVDNIWHWLAMGQHHGLPTRLVDWTYSPFVALHFATDEPAHYGVDGQVWCVNFVEANKRLPKRLRAMLEDEQSDTFTVEMLGEFKSLRDFDALAREPFVVFIEPPSLSDRILSQFALFSLMPSPLAPITDWLQKHPELSRCVVVPAELKWEVRDKLDQANINERTLFPGLDGLCRWAARYYYPRRIAGSSSL